MHHHRQDSTCHDILLHQSWSTGWIVTVGFVFHCLCGNINRMNIFSFKVKYPWAIFIYILFNSNISSLVFQSSLLSDLKRKTTSGLGSNHRKRVKYLTLIMRRNVLYGNPILSTSKISEMLYGLNTQSTPPKKPTYFKLKNKLYFQINKLHITNFYVMGCTVVNISLSIAS